MASRLRTDTVEAFRPKAEGDFSEVALAQRAVVLSSAFHGRLPTAQELMNVTEELGIEIATAMFLRTIQDSKMHGAFVRDLRGFDMSTWDRKHASGIEVVILPSNLFQSGRKWGDHVEAWRAWVSELGFASDVIETDPRRSVASNARVIFEYLARSPNRQRVILSYSQGSAEMRYLLHRRVNRDPLESVPEELENVRGWISVCGAFGGASSSRLIQEHRLRRLLARLRMKVEGRNPITLAETTTAFPLWNKPMPIPPGMKIASLIGVPYRWQLPNALHFSYDLMASRLPNDGIVTVLEASAHPGLLVPMPGLHHCSPDTAFEPILKRTLALLVRPEETGRVSRGSSQDQNQ